MPQERRRKTRKPAPNWKARRPSAPAGEVRKIPDLKVVNDKVVRAVIRSRMQEDEYALATRLVDQLVNLALAGERDSDKQRAIETLFRYNEPTPPQEKPKPAETLPPEKVRKSVVLELNAEDLDGVDPQSPAFEILKKQIVLKDEEEEAP